MNLMEEIRKDIANRNPDLSPESLEYKAEVICLIIWAAQLPDSTEEMRVGIAAETGYAEDEAGGVLASLDAGGALTAQGFHESIQEELSGDNSGMVITLLTAIALGKMKYHKDHGTYSLTDNGIRHVEVMLRKARENQ